MAYEHERDEWARGVQSMTEMERELAQQEPRRSRGIIGDPSDADD